MASKDVPTVKRTALSVRRTFAAAASSFLILVSLPGYASRNDPSALKEGTGPMVTYSGLRVYEDGSATFVVDLTSETPVSFSQKDKRLSFVLGGAKVHLRNNKNPLVAEHFRSNVVRIKLDDSKAGVVVAIDVRETVQPVHKMMSERGRVMFRVDIPPAS